MKLYTITTKAKGSNTDLILPIVAESLEDALDFIRSWDSSTPEIYVDKISHVAITSGLFVVPAKKKKK